VDSTFGEAGITGIFAERESAACRASRAVLPRQRHGNQPCAGRHFTYWPADEISPVVAAVTPGRLTVIGVADISGLPLGIRLVISVAFIGGPRTGCCVNCAHAAKLTRDSASAACRSAERGKIDTAALFGADHRAPIQR